MSSARRRTATTLALGAVTVAVATAATVGGLALTGTPTGGTGGTAESQRSVLEGLLTPVAAVATAVATSAEVVVVRRRRALLMRSPSRRWSISRRTRRHPGGFPGTVGDRGTPISEE